MKKIVKILSVIIFAISLLALPVFGAVILFGLAGSVPIYFVIITLGYVSLMIGSFICIFKYKFFPIIIISLILIILGFALDGIFWKNYNSGLCEELRAEPTCIENQNGFNCWNSEGNIGSVVPSSICDKKLTTEELRLIKQEKLDALKKINSSISIDKYSDWVNIEKSLNFYSKIVDKIISSSSPASENFENQLVAIYNCFEQEYGPGAKGEQMATKALTRKNLTEQQLGKYYIYLSSKGRNVNTNMIVAGLPNGDKNFSCEYIN